MITDRTNGLHDVQFVQYYRTLCSLAAHDDSTRLDSTRFDPTFGLVVMRSLYKTRASIFNSLDIV